MPAIVPEYVLNNGQRLPSIGLGTWMYEATGERDSLQQAIYDAIDAGVRHIDTAWIYKVEDKVGAAVKRAITDQLVKREDLVIVTKIWVTNMTKDRVMQQAKESMKSLGLDYIDILLVHWPLPMHDNGKPEEMFPLKPDGSFDFNEGIDIYNETWKAMERCVDEGITKSIGVSNFTVKQLDLLAKTARIKPVVNQVEGNLLLPNEKILQACKKHGIIMTAYRPFGGSPRPQDDGSSTENDTRKAMFESPIVKAIAAKHSKTIAQILLKFHVQRGAAVLFKSVNKKRIAENLNIFDFELTDQEMSSLKSMESGQRSCFMPKALASKNNPFAD